MLELRRYDPDGEEFERDAFVFGNEVGERLKNHQKAWSTIKRLATQAADVASGFVAVRQLERDKLAFVIVSPKGLLEYSPSGTCADQRTPALRR
jgi:hypothetical protein